MADHKKRQLTNQELLDRDLAIMVVSSPVWVTWFVVKLVAGLRNDWRAHG